MSLDPATRVSLALRGRVLTPRSDGGLTVYPDGLLLADANGVIVQIGSYRSGRKRYPGPVRDLRDTVLIPGFVDAHVHYPQTRIIGRATGPLLDWLDRSVFPEEARLSRAAYAEAVAAEMIDRMIAMGTTSAAIFSSSSPTATERLFTHLAARGMRAAAGLTLMDVRSPKALKLGREPAMKAMRRLVGRWHGHDAGRLEVAVTPRFALSCSRAMLREAGRLARDEGLLVQTHVGETKQEGRLTLEAHGYADSYVGVYDAAGLLGPRTVLAHAIHLSAAEWDRVAAQGASIAHCPDSNFFLGSGRMPLTPPVRRGITVALGSDVAAGRSFSLRRAMASAYDNAMCLGKPVDPATCFRMATLGGAQALGWERRIGSLEVGKEADVVAIPMPREATTAEAMLANLVFDTDTPNAAAVWVRGRRLL